MSMTGLKHSEETKLRIASSHRGKKLSDEHRASLREGWKKRPPMSDATREKFSRASSGRPAPWKRRQFCKYGHDTSISGRQPKSGYCMACKVSERYADKNRENKWVKTGIVKRNGEAFSSVDYDRHYQIQQGRCLGCKRHQTELKKRLHVDHDHKTGIFRGLLCVDCNFVLGRLKDKADVFHRLGEYLEATWKR